jgi:EAL domain-containing protein (putative c-di-GMP-specific phosphodiesterase class I)
MQFGQPGFTSLVSAVLAETGLSPELLTLEVTESMAMERPERAAATLMDLDALGVRLAIDDFGTGYTKLASLEQLPVDLLKIDHSFVNGIHVEDGTAIVDAIISMARSLGLRVVGEGIETARELNVLLSLGCDFGQGRFFDPPLRDHEVRDRLNDQRWNRSINAAPMEPSTGSDDSGFLKGIMVNLSEDREAVG